jgi:integrase
MHDSVRRTATVDSLQQAVDLKAQFKSGIVAATAAPYCPWTIRTAWNQYVDYAIDKSHSRKTNLTNFTSYGKVIFEVLGADTLLDQIDLAAQTKLFDHLTRECHYVGSTVNRFGSLLQQMQLYGFKRGHKHERPAPMDRMRVPEGRKRYMTDAEEDKAIAWFQRTGNDDIEGIFYFYLDTGARKDEALSLRWQDVDFDCCTITFAGKNTKSGKTRIVPMEKRVGHILTNLKAARSNDPKVFAHIKAKRLEKVWAEMRRDLGYADDPNFVIHMLRHTACTRLLRNHVPIHVVKNFMGHASIATTDRYAQFDVTMNDDVVVAYGKINKRHYQQEGRTI